MFILQIQFGPFTNDLWLLINDWFAKPGFMDYNLRNSRKHIRISWNGPILNTVPLLTKKVIHDSFKLERLLSIFHIKNGVRNHNYLKKYFHYTIREKQLLDKKWYKLSMYFNDTYL